MVAINLLLLFLGLLLVQASPAPPSACVTQDVDGDPFDNESPEVKAALSSNADIAEKFKRIYKSEAYPYGKYVWLDMELVEGDLQTIQVLTDRSAFVDASKRLAEDYGVLDAKDDMLRVSDVI